MRIAAPIALAAVSVALAACGSGSSHGGSTTTGAEPAVVTSARKAKVGSVIVDAHGRTLYRFTAEAEGLPVCTGACVTTLAARPCQHRLRPARARGDGQAPR